MKRANLVIGTRGSKLAMIYAENVKKELKKYFSKEIELFIEIILNNKIVKKNL